MIVMECVRDAKLTDWLRATSFGLRAGNCVRNFAPVRQTRVLFARSSQPVARSQIYRPKYFAFRSVYSFHFSGRSSRAKMAETGQTGTQAPQSMHSTGSIYSISSVANFGSSFLGWMQSTGQASTHAVSFVPMQGSAMMYAMHVFP